MQLDSYLHRKNRIKNNGQADMELQVSGVLLRYMVSEVQELLMASEAQLEATEIHFKDQIA